MSSIETPNPAKEHLLFDHDSSNGSETEKSRVATDTQEAKKPGPRGMVQEQPLRHHWGRVLVVILIPLAVTAYYSIIWCYLVQGTVYDEAAKYRTISGSLIFYSWFLIGVFGLSWSKYGLIGVEAAMLRSRYWGAPNLVALLEHSNSTWSSPSGWIKAVYSGVQNLVVLLKHSDGTWRNPSGWIKVIIHLEFHRLWNLLAFLSFLPFIALPLSGLIFEITDGYIKTSDTPFVQGRNMSTFNTKYERGNAAQAAWLVGSSPSLPGIGVIYTNKSVDRSKYSDFGHLPNTLPLAESIPDLFLVPQASKPVSGKTWGLRIKYDCSIVRSASQFTILSEKSASEISRQDCHPIRDSDSRCINLDTPSGNMISLWNATRIDTRNVEAYYEVGTRRSGGRYHGDYPDYETDEGNTSMVFEYAAWQYRTNGIVDKPDSPLPFNTSVGHSIEGIGSPFMKSDNNTYTVNNTFFDIKATEAREFLRLDWIANATTPLLLALAPPIGVRCVSSSVLGTAELDGVTSTFHNFQRVGPYVDPAFQYGSERFGSTAGMTLRGQFLQHYISSGLPGLQPISNGNRYEQFIDSASLLRSMNLAYAWDAFDLMYGVGSGFKREWPEPGLSSSREGKILTIASLVPGVVVGYFVLVLFFLWAVLLMFLGFCYGFQKRPVDRLDGYTMLRKGADMADELKENEDFMGGKPFYSSRTLSELPGR